MNKLKFYHYQFGGNKTDHMMMDVEPFKWCCKNSDTQISERYCQMYLEKRPLVESTTYDIPRVGK